MTKTFKDWKIGDKVRQRNGGQQGVISAFGYDCDGEVEQVCFLCYRNLYFHANIPIYVWAKPTDLMLVVETP